MSEIVKLVVFAPVEAADAVRQAMGDADAGKIGNYTHCTFSSVGTGHFLPQEGAHPTVGGIGKLEAVEEVRIETVCEKDLIDTVIAAIKKVHPYEEIPIDVYPMLLMR